jgi:hypothetical protein
MALVSCALPSSGLMRYFPGSLISPLWLAQSNGDYRRLLTSLHLPVWLFPTFSGSGPREWMDDPIVSGYLGRWTGSTAPPYGAWLRPALTWGIFFFALYGALLCQVSLVRRQWNENERLSFPLAQVQIALIEQPAPGRFLNYWLRRRTFWIAGGAVFFLHIWNGSGKYWPRYFPEIPVWYDLSRIFTDPPWTYADFKLVNAAVFFTVVGVTYFIPSTISFSLWAFFILANIERMVLGSVRGDPNVYGQQDQQFGGIIAFALAILWVGRSHWKLVFAQAFRGVRPGEPKGRYLPNVLAFWGFVFCTMVMIVWLRFAGCTWIGAIVPVLLLLLLFLVITRIIAETGLVHGQLQVPLYKPWQWLSLAGVSRPVPVESFYLTSLLQATQHDFREVVPVYASHGLKIADAAIFGEDGFRGEQPEESHSGRRLMASLALALIVGYAVSFASTLWTEYHYAWTQDQTARTPINDWGVRDNPEQYILQPTIEYQRGIYHWKHNPFASAGGGFVFTAVLAFLRLRFAWWPFHPIGYLMIDTFPGRHLWFSIFIGWLAKSIVLRFSGAKGFIAARPFFLGLIVGESAAAGFWLLLGVILNAAGLPYRPVNIMPG